MSEVVKSSLKSAVKGTAVVFLGSVFGNLIWFAVKLIIIRSIAKEEFGLYSLAVAAGSIVSVFSDMGIQNGVARFITVLYGEGKHERAAAISRASLQIGLISGIFLSACIFVLSGPIARHVFYKPDFTLPLRMIALMVPFSTVAQISAGILRGHNIMLPRVLYIDIGHPICFFVLYGLWRLLYLPFAGLILAYSLAMAIASVSIAVYGHAKKGVAFSPFMKGDAHGELLRFSLPVMIAGVMAIVFGWMDTLMLGRYTEAANIGIYNISLFLANTLQFPFISFSFVFLPIAGEMFAKGQFAELRRTYQVLTKWIFSITFPLFFILFFFPEMSLSFLFGGRFEEAAMPLRIISCGYLYQAFLGVSSIVLLVLGHTRQYMNISIMGVTVDIMLNYIFIKQLGLGIIGASSATTLSYVFVSSVNAYVLYRASKIHPITASYVKPLIGATLIGVVIYAIAKSLPLYNWMLPLYFLLFISGYSASLLFTKSIDKEDIFLLRAILQRMGIKADALEKIAARFNR